MPTPLPSSSLASNYQLARLTAFLLPLLSVNQAVNLPRHIFLLQEEGLIDQRNRHQRMNYDHVANRVERLKVVNPIMWHLVTHGWPVPKR